MKWFKDFAYDILLERKTPLHISVITDLALKAWLVTRWSTPEATMTAQLIVDVNKNKDKSRFVKTWANIYSINPNYKATKIPEQTKKQIQDIVISDVSSKQKWDIAEARIAELITLYGESSMWCYKPISDDEWIDLIVKKKWSLDTLYLQIKSRFSWWVPTPFTATAKASGMKDKNAMWIIFCLFDYQTWDLWDYLRFIPAPVFLKEANSLQWWTMLWFVSWTWNKWNNKWDEYLIDKRSLSEILSKHMERL